MTDWQEFEAVARPLTEFGRGDHYRAMGSDWAMKRAEVCDNVTPLQALKALHKTVEALYRYEDALVFAALANGNSWAQINQVTR